MKKENGLRKMKRRKSRYAKLLKKQVTISLDDKTVEYFKINCDGKLPS